MSRTFVWLVTGGAVLITATVWAARPGPPKSIGDPARYRYLYCPNCGREQPYSRREPDKQCRYCETQMIGSEESIKQARGSGPHELMAVLVLAEVVGLMFVAWLLARPRAGDPDADYVYTSCGSCRQKIQYREHQVGRRGLCPRCKRPFTFPEWEHDE